MCIFTYQGHMCIQVQNMKFLQLNLWQEDYPQTMTTTDDERHTTDNWPNEPNTDHSGLFFGMPVLGTWMAM